MAEFHGTVELAAGITPKNRGDFALVGAHDVQVDDDGNRLDTEFSNLKSALNDSVSDLIRTESILETVNYILKYGFETGRLTDDGSVNSSVYWKTTADFIPVETGRHYITASNSIPFSIYRATYDSSKNFVALAYITQKTLSRLYSIPDGVAYVKFSVAAEKDDFVFSLEANRINELYNYVDAYKNAYDNGYTLFNADDFINGGLDSGQIDYALTGRAVMKDIHYADKTINIKVDTSEKNYAIAYHTYDENGTWTGFDSGWQTEITIQANTYYRVVMTIIGGTLNVKYDIIEYVKNAHIKWMIYNNDPYSYEYTGEFLDFRKRGFDVSTLFTGDYTVDGTNVAQQGFAIYNNVLVCALSIFGGRDLNKIRLYDMTTGDIISTIDCTIGHGDTLSFSNEFYSSSDEFPLLYATADTNPAQVYVNRITRDSATLIRTLTFPLENTGYYAGHVIDTDNNILYMIGYTNKNYLSDNGGNNMIFSVWKLSNLTMITDNVYTPEFAGSFTLPFMKCLQGQKYLNGNLFLLSSTSDTSANDTRIYVVNTTVRTVISVFNQFPSDILSRECEDIDFVLDGRNYYMVIHLQNGAFYKIEF